MTETFTGLSLTSQYSASAPRNVTPSKNEAFASTSNRRPKPYPPITAMPVSLSSLFFPKMTIGFAISLKLPLLIVSAEFITPKSWAATETGRAKPRTAIAATRRKRTSHLPCKRRETNRLSTYQSVVLARVLICTQGTKVLRTDTNPHARSEERRVGKSVDIGG